MNLYFNLVLFCLNYEKSSFDLLYSVCFVWLRKFS